ncbi:HAD family hydrolase [Leucobacter albus]|uniref:HAD family hydrolase n=1 Tax=Leucobacter albus TaxID=272210 RepID=A0ABW3TLJ6_9MICO
MASIRIDVKERDVIAAIAGYDGYLFDLDGVLTPTAEVHMRAWQQVFDEVFAEHNIAPPYTADDYFTYVDGKQRYDGVASLLASRGVVLDWGTPTDGPEQRTVCGVGNRKNAVFSALLSSEGVAPYLGAVALLDALAGAPLAVVSSSKNAAEVLRAAGLRDRFAAVVDGARAEHEGLRSKPEADMFLRGAELLGVEPGRCVAFEDALSGVASAASAGCGLVVGVDRAGAAHPGAAEALLRAGAHMIVGDLGELVAGGEQ